MMTPIELEQVYDKPDPWGYQTNIADVKRKRIILDILRLYGPFERALDIACGEGWITKDIPARMIYGMEASKQAMERWDNKIIPWQRLVNEFDLVMITGALYENYDWQSFIDQINEVSTKYILTCNIADREFPKAIEGIQGELIQLNHFPYFRSEQEQFTQRLRVYKR